eukprot:g13481.t1
MTMIMQETAALISALLLPAEAFFVSPPATATATALKGGAAVSSAVTLPTMKVTGIESTPNPGSFKFTLDQCLGNPAGSTWSTGSGTTEGAPELLRPVLELTDVESVYSLSDWLCINKKPSAKWDAIVPAAVEALGGAADSLDPLTLLMASGGDGRSSWQRSEMDGITIRLQVSNGIPIQVEACPPGGTPLRRKLSSRFVDAMTEFVGSSGDEMAFFKGRQWIPRGVRYPTTEEWKTDTDSGSSSSEPSTSTGTAKPTAAAELAQEALDAAVEEVELAYHESRLRGAVQAALIQLQKNAEAAANAAAAGGEEERTVAAEGAPAESAATARAAVRAAAAVLQSREAEKGEVVGAVDALCAVAENTADAVTAAAKDALDALIGFAASGDGPVAARRAAVAYIGGAGDAAGSAGLEAVAAVFRGDKNPGVRRTAGDALSDLGDPDAIPIAVAGLHDKSKLVRWRAARVVGELGSREQEAVSLDEAREGEMEFEVAFEMSDAARKVRARVASGSDEGEGEAGAAAGVGPVWKQIQERAASRKTEAARQKTDRLDLRVLMAKSSAMYTQNKARWLVINWVKNNIIEGFCPLSHGEKEWVRANWRLSCVEEFPVIGLHNRAVKHKIVELYAATTSQFKQEMANEVGGGRLLHLNLDLWVDKFSSLKYIGIRLFYVDRSWRLKSRLLAVRQFNTTMETLESQRLSELLQCYLESVLAEDDLDVSKIFSATSDSGSDVKRLCDVLLPGLWELCVCHVLNCRLVEAIGTHVDPKKSANPAARKVIMAVKKAVEHINKSTRAKAIFADEQVRHYSQCSHRKLVNAAPQRWSGVSNVLEAVLVNTAAVLGLAALKLTTFNVDSPLEIRTPARKLAQGGVRGASSGEQKTSSAPKQHGDLTMVARQARAHLNQSVDWRWFKKRYHSEDARNTDFVFDMQMALHPTTAGLEYVDKLASTPENAATVKKTITDKVIALAVELAQKEADGAGNGMGGDKQGGNGEPASKRARSAPPGTMHPIFASPGNKREAAATARFASLGLFKQGGGAAEGPLLEESARAELKTLRAISAGTLTAELSCEGVLIGGSDGLARTHSWPGATDAKYVEMILFLHGNLDLIPDDIPELDDKESHLPGRLDNPNPELEGLSGTFSPVDVTEEEDEEGEDAEEG